jgi:hypothetical protein
LFASTAWCLGTEINFPLLTSQLHGYIVGKEVVLVSFLLLLPLLLLLLLLLLLPLLLLLLLLLLLMLLVLPIPTTTATTTQTTTKTTTTTTTSVTTSTATTTSTAIAATTITNTTTSAVTNTITTTTTTTTSCTAPPLTTTRKMGTLRTSWDSYVHASTVRPVQFMISICVRPQEYFRTLLDSTGENINLLCDAMTCSLTEVYRNFGGMYCRHLQGQQARKKQQADHA